MASAETRPADLPLAVEPVKATVPRLGSGPTLTLPSLVTTTGVSSIHSAVRYDDEYGTWIVKVSFRVRSNTVIVQSSCTVELSLMTTCMWSPGTIVILSRVIAGPGMISHQ